MSQGNKNVTFELSLSYLFYGTEIISITTGRNSLDCYQTRIIFITISFLEVIIYLLINSK